MIPFAKSAESEARAEQPAAEKAMPATSPLASLRAFFESMQKSRLLRRDYSRPQRRRDPRRAQKKSAAKKAWEAAQAEGRLDVAGCPRCRAWFPTTADRNRHRASLCPKRPGVAEVAQGAGR